MSSPYASPSEEELELRRQRGFAAQANPSFSPSRVQRAMGPVTLAGVRSPSTSRIISQALSTVNKPTDTSFIDDILAATDLDQIDPVAWNDFIRNIPSPPPAAAGTGSTPALQTPVPPSPAGVGRGRSSRRRRPLSLSPAGSSSPSRPHRTNQDEL